MTDAPETRDQILDAAEGLFAQQGFTATSIKQIAAGAKVNSALLYYYFADKETLYKAVLARQIQGLVASLASRVQGAADPVDAVRRFVEAQAEAVLAHPLFPRLMLRELLDHEARHASDEIAVAVGRGLMPLVQTIAAGQRAGQFRPDLDPRLAAISVVGQLMYFFVARPAVARLLAAAPDAPPAPITPETVRAYARHAAEFAIQALSV
jgi:TetR/AcrR family transcriptional regulator